MTKAGLGRVDVNTVTKRIAFPSVLDYVRFQLTATPMAGLLGERNDGRLSFPQEAYVATAGRGR